MSTAKTAKSGVNVFHMSDMWAKNNGSFAARITERGELALHHPAFYRTYDSFVEFKDLLPKYLVHDFAACELVLSRYPHGSVVQTPQDEIRISLKEVLDLIENGELLVVNRDEGVTEIILPKLPHVQIPVGMKYVMVVHTATVAGRAYHGFVLEARVLRDHRVPRASYVPKRYSQPPVPKAVNG